MNVAQVTQHYLPVVGGQEVYIENLNRVFREVGWKTTVYQPDRGVKSEEIVTVPRIRGVGRFIPGAEANLFNLMIYLTKVRQIEKADVTIAHYAFSAWPLRKLAKKTIVLSHGIEWHLENQNWDDHLHQKIARSCFDDFPHIVNDTHYLRHFGIDIQPGQGAFTEVAPRKWFIPNCVDVSHFKKCEGIERLKDQNIILVPRQITADRGIDLAIRAFRLLADEDKSLTLCIMGKQRSGIYLTYLHKLIRELELKNRVFFEPPAKNLDMPAFYCSALVTLIPTLRREGTSLSALESMSCGTATVSTDVAGLADLPTVQAAPDANSVAQALLVTIRDRIAIGQQQQNSVRQLFNMTNWNRAWLEVINQIGRQH